MPNNFITRKNVRMLVVRNIQLEILVGIHVNWFHRAVEIIAMKRDSPRKARHNNYMVKKHREKCYKNVPIIIEHDCFFFFFSLSFFREHVGICLSIEN